VIAARILAVISAMCFVLAFTLALMLAPDTTLGEAFAILHLDWVAAVADVAHKSFSEWVWLNLALPVLTRPVWLLPIGLALVAAGAAVTLANRSSAAASHRRRS
jgi:hypothetical protein